MSQITKITIFFAAVLSLLGGERPSDQLEEIDGYKARSNKEIVVAFPEFAPKRMHTEKGVTGYHAEILNRLGSRLGKKIVFKKCLIKDCLKMLTSGEADLISGLVKNKEREEYLDFLKPEFNHVLKTSFYVAKGSKVKITSYKDLKKLRVGVVAKTVYFDSFQKDKSLNKITYPSRRDMMTALIKGEIDTFGAPDYQGDFDITTFGLQSSINKARYSHEWSFKANYFAMSKKSIFQKEKDRFEEEISELHADGSIDSITEVFMQKYKVPHHF